MLFHPSAWKRHHLLLGICAVALAGCSGTSSTTGQELFGEASRCFRMCAEMPLAAVEGAPISFSTLYAEPASRQQFDALVAQLPAAFSPLTSQLADDPPGLAVQGSLVYVLRTEKNHPIYVYFEAGVSDINPAVTPKKRRYPTGRFWIAVDPAERKMAGILNSGSDFEKYQLVGDHDVLVALLAYLAARESDVQKAWADGAEEMPPEPDFPLQSASASRAEERLAYLKARFSNGKIVVEVSGPERPPKPQWWVVNSEFTSCHLSGGPAEKLDEFAGFTDRPTTEDFRDANGQVVKVEVSVDRGDGYDRLWTYFRSEQQCLAEQVNYSQNLADKYR